MLDLATPWTRIKKKNSCFAIFAVKNVLCLEAYGGKIQPIKTIAQLLLCEM